MGRNKPKRRRKSRWNVGIMIILSAVVLTLLVFLVYPGGVKFIEVVSRFLGRITGLAMGDFGDLRLKIDNDPALGNDKYTYCSDMYCAFKHKGEISWNVLFYANFTRISSGEAIDNSNGSCTILFYTTGYGPVFNMDFNSTSKLWQFNSSFRYKGNNRYNISCTDGAEYANLEEAFFIRNTIPYIPTTANGFIDADNNYVADVWQCIEDIACYYNLYVSVSEDDLNDVLTFHYNPSIINTTLTNFTLNLSTGILKINVTNSNYTGLRQIELNVRDSGDGQIPDSGSTQSALLYVNILDVNDAPIFTNLQDRSFNETQRFIYIINAIDEESNYPLAFNVSFYSCKTAPWSDRMSTNCFLFDYLNNSDRSIIIDFVPSANDVGNYSINFTVTDFNNKVLPYNASKTMGVTFRVLNINDAPYFTYICDNERGAIEGVQFECWVNISDTDSYNFTLKSNVSWFLNLTNKGSVTGNVSFKINFTADDLQVGNWSINITVTDDGLPKKSNSTIIQFYVDNENDSVYLYPIGDVTAYKSVNYKIYINASDNDLLIPDKRVLDEMLIFTANVPWINFIVKPAVGNITTAIMNFTITEDIIGVYNVEVNVTDRYGYSNYSRFITIYAYNNTAPIWDISTDYNLAEDEGFVVNLFSNVSDPDGDPIIFSYLNLTYFPSFDIAGGWISFSAKDGDVGFQRVIVNASDGKFGVSPIELRFNISNVDDAPFIEEIGEQNVTEDNRTRVFIRVYDEDLAIRQKDYYDEWINYNIVIINESGSEVNLFGLGFDSIGENFTQLAIDFTPKKRDLGHYNITINASDRKGLNASYSFDMIVFEINHAPSLDPIGNQSAGVGVPYFIDIDSTDIEDGNETSGNLTYGLDFLSGTGFFGIDAGSGIINFTANAENSGIYEVNLSVRDSTGMVNSSVFWIFIYDVPSITSLTGSPIRGAENENIFVNVRANHTIGNDLRFDWYIKDELRYNMTGSGTGGLTTLVYRLSFNDETTCGRDKNLTLNVSNPIFSSTFVWGLIVNHTSQPPTFVGPILNISEKSPEKTLCLLEYFQDADYGDICYPNESLSFSFRRYNESYGEQASGPINTAIIHDSSMFCMDSIKFSTQSRAEENFDISANDGVITVLSNIFHVLLDPSVIVTPQPVPQPMPQPMPQPEPEPTPKPKIFKIIMPDKINLLKPGTVQIPLMLKNDAGVDLFDIDLIYWLIKDGVKVDNPNITISRNYFSVLSKGQSYNVSIEMAVNDSGRTTYELFVNASVRSPKLTDWAKVNIELMLTNTTEIERVIVFTEELIVENPECLELRELLNEAKDLYSQGKTEEALKMTDVIIDSCRQALSQKNRELYIQRKDYSLIFYIIVLSIAFMFSGLLYYLLRRFMFRRRESKEVMKYSGNIG